jgi:hypothetical protein
MSSPSNSATARRASRGEVSAGNSGTPLSIMKHLTPNTPASCRAPSSPSLPGTAPPQNPTSTAHWPRAAARLTSRAATSSVGGSELSGMSTIVVTPPAAAARVAVAKPSHSVRPGSLTCTWVSTRPGSSTSSGTEHHLPAGVHRGVAGQHRGHRPALDQHRGRSFGAVDHGPVRPEDDHRWAR